MSKFAATFAVFVAAVVAGCASSPPAPAAKAETTAAAAAAASAAEQETLTGSRLARKASDRHVRSTDNQTYRDDNQIRSLGNDIGARSH